MSTISSPPTVTRRNIEVLLFLGLCALCAVGEAKSLSSTSGYGLFSNLTKRSEKICHYDNEAVAAVWAMVCEICHSTYGREDPNLRLRCRANCFTNSVFKNCFIMMAKQSTRQTMANRYVPSTEYQPVRSFD